MSNRIATRAVAFAVAFFSVASVTEAQYGDPEQGDMGQWEPPPEQQPPPPQPPPQQQQQQEPPPRRQQQQQQPAPQQQQPAQQQNPNWFQGEQPPAMATADERPPAAQDGPSADTDHGKVVGALGFGFFGIETIQMDPGFLDRTSGETKVRAPLFGIRYWISETIGLDAAVGVNFRSKDRNTATVDPDEAPVLVGGEDGVFGLTIHAGLPITAKSWEHFAFHVIPEIDFSYASGTILAELEENDTDLTGLEFKGALQLGGELQLGFLGVPQLGIQGTVGLGLRWFSETATDVFVEGESDPPLLEAEETGIGLTTTATIRAVYYFD